MDLSRTPVLVELTILFRNLHQILEVTTEQSGVNNFHKIHSLILYSVKKNTYCFCESD